MSLEARSQKQAFREEGRAVSRAAYRINGDLLREMSCLYSRGEEKTTLIISWARETEMAVLWDGETRRQRGAAAVDGLTRVILVHLPLFKSCCVYNSC